VAAGRALTNISWGYLMNKTEMAEWLAGNVLHWEMPEKTFSRLRRTTWQSQFCSDRTTFGWLADLQGVIYSPDGFFAVWDKVINEDLRFEPGKYGAFGCFLGSKDAYGKDRYEAFYNAVYEAINEKINTRA